jgi:hypothetical protein
MKDGSAAKTSSVPAKGDVGAILAPTSPSLLRRERSLGSPRLPVFL